MTDVQIAPEDRTMAALTHLSGLSGYIVPLAGVIVPAIIWITKKDTPLIAAIARQAVLLNVAVFVAVGLSAILMVTILLIPAVFLFWFLLFIAAVALPIVGAVKANGGIFYKYPVVGANP